MSQQPFKKRKLTDDEQVIKDQWKLFSNNHGMLPSFTAIPKILKCKAPGCSFECNEQRYLTQHTTSSHGERPFGPITMDNEQTAGVSMGTFLACSQITTMIGGESANSTMEALVQRNCEDTGKARLRKQTSSFTTSKTQPVQAKQPVQTQPVQTQPSQATPPSQATQPVQAQSPAEVNKQKNKGRSGNSGTRGRMTRNAFPLSFKVALVSAYYEDMENLQEKIPLEQWHRQRNFCVKYNTMKNWFADRNGLFENFKKRADGSVLVPKKEGKRKRGSTVDKTTSGDFPLQEKELYAIIKRMANEKKRVSPRWARVWMVKAVRTDAVCKILKNKENKIFLQNPRLEIP